MRTRSIAVQFWLRSIVKTSQQKDKGAKCTIQIIREVPEVKEVQAEAVQSQWSCLFLIFLVLSVCFRSHYQQLSRRRKLKMSKKNGEAAKQSNKYIEIGNWVFYKISEDKYEAIDCYGHIERITPEFKSKVLGGSQLNRGAENNNFWAFSIFDSIEITGSFEVVSDYIKNRN